MGSFISILLIWIQAQVGITFWWMFSDLFLCLFVFNSPKRLELIGILICHFNGKVKDWRGYGNSHHYWVTLPFNAMFPQICSCLSPFCDCHEGTLLYSKEIWSGEQPFNVAYSLIAILSDSVKSIVDYNYPSSSNSPTLAVRLCMCVLWGERQSSDHRTDWILDNISMALCRN